MTLARVQGEHPLGHYVWKLLVLQWRLFYSGFLHARLIRKIGYFVLALIILGVAAVVFATSWGLLMVLRSPERVGLVDLTPYLAAVPVLVATVAFIGVLLFSFGVLLQALYLTGDMDFLLSAPVPTRAVYVAKLLQAILPNLGLTLLFGLPVLYGLGVAGGYNVLYYPLVLIVLIAVVLTAAGLASLLVMGIVRLFPARTIAELLALLGGGISILCSQSQFLVRSAEPSRTQVTQALGLLTLLNAPWSPFAWVGRGLVDIGEGRWLTGAGLVILTLGVAGAIFAATLNIAERLYYSGWARLSSGTRRKKNVRAAPSRPGAAPFAAIVARYRDRIVPAPLRGLVAKDALVIRRDLRNMSQLLSPLILGVIYAAVFVRGGGEPPAGRGQAPVWFMQTLRNALVYGNILISLFVGWSLLTRLALMGFSQEGKYYWLLKSAPLSANRLLTAKFIVAYLPTLMLGWGFYLVISLLHGAGLGALLFGMMVVAFCLAGAAGIALAFGVMGVNLEWNDPRRMVSSTTGCIGFIGNAGFVVVALALFFGIPIVFTLLQLPESIGQLAGLVLGGVVSVICAFIPPWLVRTCVPRIGEV